MCLDLSFWLGLDLVVADLGYVMVDLLGLCYVYSLIANKKLMYSVVSSEFSNGYSGLKNGVDFWILRQVLDMSHWMSHSQ